MEWDEDEVSWSQPGFPMETPEMSGKAETQGTGMGGWKSRWELALLEQSLGSPAQA